MAVKLNQHDLEFILKQIKIAEANSTAHAGDEAVALLDVRIDADGNYGAEGTLAISQPHLPYGLRTVDGSYNNLIPGRELWGASDQIMPRMLQPNWTNEQDEGTVDINGPAPGGEVANTAYGVGGSPDSPMINGGHTGNVIDSDPRTISNLIVDQTLKNPAAIMAALKYAEFNGTGAEFLAAVEEIQGLHQAYLAAAANEGDAVAELAALDAVLTTYGIEMDGNTVLLPNVAPDEGLSAPFNGWMTFFGQFFDHGLDLIHKGDNGTIFVPLAADDPLRTHGPDGIAGSGDEVPPNLAFMALSRLKPEAGPGADGVLGTDDDTMEAKNKTTPFVDQNQTYTSHPSHQVFLREYVMVGGKPMATGHLLDGVDGGLATWKDVKLQAEEKLGIVLSDIDVLGVPLLRTDAYGEFIRGPDGFPQVVYNIGPDLIPNTADDLTVSATPGNPVVLADINGGLGPVRTSHQFLDDIAHNANPVGTVNGQPAILQPDINTETDPLGNPIPSNPDLAPAYDNELLDRHFITGDGRGNENIGLTAVHHVFHAEHNRQVDSVKKQILEIAQAGKASDLAFLNEWLLTDLPVETDVSGLTVDDLQWDGERLFQVGRFSTEMQYQHLVFEEFGRKVQPNIDVFVFNTITDVNPAIFAEFAHTVYRFGHSMLTDHLKLLPLDENGVPLGADGLPVDIASWGVDVGLIEAFLNPIMYDEDGSLTAEQAAGAIARGMTYVHGNAIDEFVTESLRNNLLGLPLDLAAINIARGRDAGVPSLNEAREQLYSASNSTWLKPYESWADFAANLKTPASIINFIAAYGEHPLILAADTLEEKRDAAMTLLGFGSSEEEEAVVIANGTFEAPPMGTVINHPLGAYTTTAPDGWTLTGTGGLFNPVPSVVDPAGLTGPSVAWLSANALLSQMVGILEEGARYRLTLDVADRSDMDSGWPGGEVRLVDSNDNVLASEVLSAPADGGWSTITFETGPIDALQAGLGLRIEIVHGGGSSDQILVDDVRLDVLRMTEAPEDRLHFLNGTGAWSGVETGLNNVDLWIGGLAERVMPFGGMLGSTFNAVFELQMENLQEGDRFYYLSRTQGLNLLNELENNAFAKMIMANTDLVQPGPDGIRGTEDDVVTHHIGLDSFAKYDGVLEVSQAAQIAADNAWGANDPFLEALRAKVQRDDPSTAGPDANYLRFTGGEHMVMGGTDGDDTIIGGDGDDGIWGGDGDDRIESGHGVDLVSGGAGDDIITDSGDTGDFIKGESGDDVIANSNGLDVLMGGDGKDVFLVGVDATEVFGGEGDDFMLGGLDHDFLLGNEGNDWMEGGDGFDVLNGDNSELFFNSTILGHDVLIAGENENDFDAESGDDIMVQGESVMRNEGMFGFDWAIYKGSAVAADADMRIPIFTTVADDILRDRFDQTEALSGWDHNDILRGDDRGQNEEIEVELQLHENHYLSQAGVDRIDGLRDLLGLEDWTPEDPDGAGPLTADDVDAEKVVAWTAGNLLIGGDGSDLIEGRGGDDFIHGDAWLNVRIRIVGDGQANSAENEIATVDTLAHIFAETDVDTDGQPIPSEWHGKSLSELLLTRVIKPNQMHIQREIKYDQDPSNDTDTAIFAGNRDWYEITHVGDKTFVARREMEEVDPQISEGTDTLVGIERILFADGIYTIRETGNHDPSGRLTIDGLPAREGHTLTVDADAIRDLNNPDGTVDPATIIFRWQIERNDGTGDYINIPGVSGNTFTPEDDHVGLRIRVIGTYQDAGGVIEVVMSQPTDVVLGENDAPTGAVLISDMTPTEGRELTATATFNDPDGITDAFEEGLLTYQWQSSGSTLGPWVDVPSEDGGNSRSFVPGPELVGRYVRMVIDYTDDGGTEETVVSAVTQVVGNFIDVNLPVIDADNGDGDGIVDGITNGGTTIGDDWVVVGAGNNAISGGAGDDALYGGAGEDDLDGGGGNDTLDGGLDDDEVAGGEGNDIIIHGNGHGSDTIDGGDGLDTLRITGNSPGADDNVTIALAGGLITAINGSTTVTGVEAAELRLDHGTDTLVYNTDENLSVNLLSGAATGFSFTRGVENVTAGSGNDTLLGNSVANVLAGGDGNDEVRGGFGNDVVHGGAGDDQLWGEQGDDILEGGDGDDRIDGGDGIDTASYVNAAAAVTVSLSGQNGKASFEEQDSVGAGFDRLIDIENLTGSTFGDSLTGDGDDNRIDGGLGADEMIGLGGDDTYIVDDAGDVVTEVLGGGDDTVVSNLEGLTLAENVENIVLGNGIIAGTGNALDNTLAGNALNNTLDGGDGVDTVILDGPIQDFTFGYVNASTTTVQSAAGGMDTLINIERAAIGGVVYNLVRGDNLPNGALNGTAQADLVLGFSGADTLRGAGGDDILIGGLSSDAMGGGAGNDTYVVTEAGDFVTEDATVVPGSDGIDTIVSTVTRNLGAAGQVAGDVENLTLVGTGNINGTGNALANTLIGNSGNNILSGGAGTDTLIGNDGSDTLNGGGANDVLDGGVGDDVLNGGGGTADVAVFDGPAGNYSFGFTAGTLTSITDVVGNDGTDSLTNIERLRFGDGEDLTIVTNAGAVGLNTPSIVFGTDGDDDIVGGNEGDVIIGGLGNDTLSGYDVGTADDDVVPPQNDDDVFLWRANAAGGETDGFDLINGGGEGTEGDLFQVVGNDEAETYRIYTEEEALARGIAIQGEEPEIFITRQVGAGPEVVIAELIEIEEIVINGNGVSSTGDLGNGDTVEMYGNFDVTTSLRPNTITILGTDGDDTVNLSSLLSAHRIVFKTQGGNDTIIGKLRPQDVIELPDGTTIADYAVTIDEETGVTKLVGAAHSLTFVAPHGMPSFTSEYEDDQDDEVSNPRDEGAAAQDDDLPEEHEPSQDDEDNDEAAPLPTGSSGGTAVADVLLGAEGNDAIIALGGDDVLRGDDGNDFLSGGDGRDMAFGGAGNDDILGGAEADMLYGDGGDDRIFGGDGDDLIDAGTGNDQVQGGAGNDTFLASADDGNDVFWGDGMAASCGDGTDTLDMSAITANATVDLGTGLGGRGSASSSPSGNDVLWGVENIVTGSGNDVITASRAVNVMDGGAGNDTFRFLSSADADGDTILGFQPGDRIDLSAIDADVGSANHQFTLVTGTGFNAAGALKVTHESVAGEDYTLVEGNTNGGSDAEFIIRIKGNHTLTANDFDL